MDLQRLQRVVVDALEDVKGQDIRIYNTVGLSDMFDRVVLASGTSNRQTRALASRVAERVKAAGGRVVSIEGTDSGEWVLVDLGDIVVHIMLPAIRTYYELEEMWGSKPVRIRLATDRSAARRAGADGEAASARPAAKRPAARKTAKPRKAAKKPASARKSAKRTAPKKRAAAPKTAARKSSPGKSTRKKAANKQAR
ncbi:MAG: ribosome silencing factor [Burkholderiaceae bacterium]